MSGNPEPGARGKELLQEVALRYAGQHGLRPEKIEWVNQGYEWWLKVSDTDHAVKIVFSQDEIDFVAELAAVDKESKIKIRNAFASLSM